MSRGGKLPYQKGAAFERLVRDHYEVRGWLAVRQPKSQSPFDLICVRETVRHLVQCKLAGKIATKEKDQLVEMCHRYKFSPVLAWKDKGEIKLRYLDGKEEEFTL